MTTPPARRNERRACCYRVPCQQGQHGRTGSVAAENNAFAFATSISNADGSGRRLGGQGFGQLKLGLLNEVVGRSKLGCYVFGSQPPDAGNAEILARFGTPYQRTHYLMPLLAGELKSAYAMTEPQAGADPTMLTTQAVLENDEWVLNGQRYFITNASIADFFIIMAVTDPDEVPHRWATQVIVPAGTPGLRIVREIGSVEDPKPVWGRSHNHAEVELVDVRVPLDSLLGGRGEGIAIAQSRLGRGRIHHCMLW